MTNVHRTAIYLRFQYSLLSIFSLNQKLMLNPVSRLATSVYDQYKQVIHRKLITNSLSTRGVNYPNKPPGPSSNLTLPHTSPRYPSLVRGYVMWGGVGLWGAVWGDEGRCVLRVVKTHLKYFNEFLEI